jgi:two-component system nitrate/nitrite response regulator NarL
MKVLVADEHPLIAEAFESLLKRQFPSANVSIAESLPRAREAVSREPVDLLLIDMLCGGPNDFALLPQLVNETAPGRVLAFGRCSGRADVRKVQAAGAHGFVAASSRPELICAAIGLVVAGGSYFQEPSASELPHDEDASLYVERLSARQREVLVELVAGKSNKAIARALGISVPTVKLHVQSILRLTGARNRTQLAVLARHLGEGAPTRAGG